MDVAVVIRMGHDRVEDWDRAVSYAVEGERLGPSRAGRGRSKG